MHRFFVTQDQIKNDSISIYGSDVNHIRNVLRLKVGDVIEILDGSGKLYSAKISKENKEAIECEIISAKNIESEPTIRVTIAQSLPKAHKIDTIIQKCTELGVYKIIPFISERSIIKLDDKKKKDKVLRWQKIAKEASEQSGRGIIPQIDEIKNFSETLAIAKQYDLCLIPWEMEEKNSLKAVLQKNKNAQNMLILIGPEGGFSNDEVEKAKKSGFIPITLGKRILRTETAGPAILSMIMYEFDQ